MELNPFVFATETNAGDVNADDINVRVDADADADVGVGVGADVDVDLAACAVVAVADSLVLSSLLCLVELVLFAQNTFSHRFLMICFNAFA